MRRHLTNLVQWYATPVGAAFVLFLAAGMALALLGNEAIALIVILVPLGAIVPYKLARERADRERLSETLREIAETTVKLQSIPPAATTTPSPGADLVQLVAEEVERVDNITNSRIDHIEHEMATRLSELRREARSELTQLRALNETIRAESRSELTDLRHFQMESATRLERAVGLVERLERLVRGVEVSLSQLRQLVSSVVDADSDKWLDLGDDSKS